MLQLRALEGGFDPGARGIARPAGDPGEVLGLRKLRDVGDEPFDEVEIGQCRAECVLPVQLRKLHAEPLQLCGNFRAAGREACERGLRGGGQLLRQPDAPRLGCAQRIVESRDLILRADREQIGCPGAGEPLHQHCGGNGQRAAHGRQQIDAARQQWPRCSKQAEIGQLRPGLGAQSPQQAELRLFVRELLQADDERIGARRPGAQLLQGVFRNLLGLALRTPRGDDSARPILRIALRLPAVLVQRHA